MAKVFRNRESSKSTQVATWRQVSEEAADRGQSAVRGHSRGSGQGPAALVLSTSLVLALTP